MRPDFERPAVDHYMKSRRSVCRTLLFSFCAVLWMLQPENAQSAPAGAFDEPDRILWTFKAKRALTASPALSPDGLTIYVPSADRTLYAFPTEQFDADPEDPGTTLVKWSELRLVGSTAPWRFPAPVYASPTVDEDGAIFVSCTDGKIYKITDQGSYGRVERPRFFTRGTVTPSVIGEDGTVYAGSSDNHLYAFFPDGAMKWAYASSNDVRVPVITDDEEILVASGGFLRTISADGAQVAEFTPRSAIQSIPALGHDGEVYFGANDDRVYALAAGGTTNDIFWRFNTKKNVMSSPAVGADGRIYIAADNLRLYSFTTNGAIYWSRGLRAPIRSPLSIGVDGSIYAGADDKRLYVFSPEDGAIIWSIKTKAPVRSSAVLDAFGVVYFTSGKTIYAVQSDAMADDFDEAPWPMFRKDQRHTARATECRPFLIEEPFFTEDGSDTASVSNGFPASITVVVRAGSPVSYQWRLNGVDIDLEENPTAGNATLEIDAVSPLDAGEYTVAAFNDCGEVESEIFTLNVDSAPIITGDLTNQLLLVGSTLTLRVEAAGTPPLRYEWYKDGVLQPGFTNAALIITNVTTANSGVYQVVVANQFPPPATSSSATVTVYNVTLTRADQPLGAGQRHSLAVQTNNTLWTWGLNNFGQLGDGTSGSSGTNLVFRNRPNLVGTNGTVSTNAVWAAVSGGSRGYDVATNQPGGFSIGLQTNGTLWAWGLNNRGQLGIGSLESQRVPVQVGADTNWIQAEAGATHVIALKRDGTMWTWGGNEAGQLGIGTRDTNSLVPVRVGTDSAWVEVRAGGFFSLARRADGTIWAWGTNANGQLGLGHDRTQRSPVMVGTNTDWVRISAGVFHSLGLRSDGTLWAWGRNNFGQLGLGTGSANGNEGTGTDAPERVGTATDWQFIEAGRFHSFGIRASGALWGWGANHFGQIGDGAIGSPANTNDANRTAPVPVAPELAWRFVDASAHSLGMTTDGRIWGWGWNNQGQVGDGTGNGTGNNNRSVPVLLTFNADTNIITTNAIPLITQQPVSDTVNQGETAGFSVTATGQAPLTYQWYFNSNAIPASVNSNATTATLVITNASSTNAGFYHVVVNNLFGNATSSVATLTVLATNGPPVITQNPETQGGFAGGTITFTVAAAGATPLFYQWYYNSNAIDVATNSTANSPTLVLTNTTTTNNGWYHAVVTNTFGSATSAVARLSLLPPIFPSNDGAAESSVTLRIKSIQWGANGVTVTADELPSGVLILEFKDALPASEWRPLMTNETGRLEFVDPVPADRARFYRLRRE
jgi:alpha-tubulin suppressor-like RCC1 family protein/outer membrane protein assembly factor BamB